MTDWKDYLLIVGIPTAIGAFVLLTLLVMADMAGGTDFAVWAVIRLFTEHLFVQIFAGILYFGSILLCYGLFRSE